ncbi:MAG: transketolase [Anaerolineae bacterium]
MLPVPAPDLQEQAINTIRTLSIDAVQKANSGHPGLPMGAAAMAFALWTQHLRFNPANPKWSNRDRFVLSAGHGSMLLYSLLHLTGYDLSLDDLKNFRQWGSKTPGHPEYGLTPGVEVTTGPLGSGAATSVGLALAEAYLAKHFNRSDFPLVDHFTYALVGDGDLMEGVSSEAASIAGTWGLGKLIWLYDSNHITLDGKAEMTFTEDVAARFEAYGWHVQTVDEGNDVAAISAAISAAKAVGDKPSLIVIHTVIGFGSPNKGGTSEAHGSPLGADEIKLVKEFYGWPQEDFYVPDAVRAYFNEAKTVGAALEADWNALFTRFAAQHPEEATAFRIAQRGELPAGWDADIPVFTPDKKQATRNASGVVLNAIAKHIPTMIGGDADLAGSTKTLLKGALNTGPTNPAERNVRFGVREFAMGAIVNGLALHGGIIKPYSATFLTFSDYMRGAIRLGSLMEIPAIYVFTHDSIALGEDGPTHQPIEHVMALRLIPHLHVFRPADANETAATWKTMMTLKLPSATAFTRQDLPVLTGEGIGGVEAIHAGVARGGYILSGAESTPDVILIGTGSEVHIAVEAATKLARKASKPASSPPWELFEAQDATYRDSVLPPAVTARVSIEAGVTTGWQKWGGANGIALGIDHFGASAPYQKLYEEYGLTATNVAAAAKRVLGK